MSDIQVEQKYQSALFYLHAYFASCPQWPSDVEGKERTRIVLIELATIIGTGPAAMFRIDLLGDLVWSFMNALMQQQDWADPGATIGADDFKYSDIVTDNDPILRQAQELGFAEVYRRAVEVVEVWNAERIGKAQAERSSKPALPAVGNSAGELRGQEQDRGRRRTSRGGNAKSEEGGSGQVPAHGKAQAKAVADDSERVQVFKLPYKYCRSCRRNRKIPVAKLRCTPPGSDKACFECRRAKKTCTNHEANLKFPNDPGRDTDGEPNPKKKQKMKWVLKDPRSSESEEESDVGSESEMSEVDSGARAGLPQINLSPLMSGKGKRVANAAPASLTIPIRRGRSHSPLPSKRAKAPEASTRTTRSRSVNPPLAAPASPARQTRSASASTRAEQREAPASQRDAAITSSIAILNGATTEHRARISTLQSEVRGLVGGYRDVRGDVQAMRDVLGKMEVALEAQKNSHAEEISKLKGELTKQGAQILALQEFLAHSGLSFTPPGTPTPHIDAQTTSVLLAQNSTSTSAPNCFPPAPIPANRQVITASRFAAPVAAPVTAPVTAPVAAPVTAPAPASTSAQLTAPAPDPTTVASGVSYPALTYVPMPPGASASASRILGANGDHHSMDALGLTPTSKFIGTTAGVADVALRPTARVMNRTALDHPTIETMAPATPSRSVSPDEDESDLTDIDDEASASASGSGNGKRKANSKRSKVAAKKPKQDRSLTPNPGRGRGKWVGVAASRRSPTRTDGSKAS
ncbi:hypothetical protein BKA70DRAFT_1428225 [Coprinopsis sp. MPI-PUGE-AT-0042]|nr:hypothetical protein BKA70DRAFT_1428225 [Coprinopsis sp. MPI-PUGE-AT-0042]